MHGSTAATARVSTSRRARLAVALLAGTYLLAALQVIVVAVVTLAVLDLLPGPVAARIGAPVCIATVGAAGYATWRALRGRYRELPGVTVTRADAPQLWNLLDDCAAAVGVRPPDAVTVVADASVALTERFRLLGLLRGPRRLHLGLPVLLALEVAHLRALVAHEVAHDRTAEGRAVALAYRGRLALGRTVARIGPRNVAGAAVRAYARLVHRVAGPVVQAHELAADGAAAAVAGREATVQALTHLPLLSAAQRLFLGEYLGPGWQAGYAPDDIFGGFLRVLAARADELRAAVAAAQPVAAPPVAVVPGETHPPLAERLHALGWSPDPAGTGTSAGPDPADSTLSAAAGDLVPDLPGLGRVLQGIVFPSQGRRTVGWDTFFTAARDAEMQQEAGAALDALSRVVGAPLTSAADVLDLAAQGSLAAAVGQVFPQLAPEDARLRAVGLVELLLALAARRSGVACWRHSWSGAAELVGNGGTRLHLGQLAALACAADTAGEARELLAELRIDVAAARADRPAGSARVLGGLVNLTVDGVRSDLLLLHDTMLVIPGLPRSRAGAAKRRLAELATADVAALAAVPGTRPVPHEEITGVARVRRAPRTWRLTMRGGAVHVIRAGVDSDELPGGWGALDGMVTDLAGRR